MNRITWGALFFGLLGVTGVPARGQMTFERITVPIRPPGNAAIWMAAADFNVDGRSDLAFVSVNGTVMVSFGRGDNGIDTPRTVVASFLPTHRVIAADVNGDGRPDVIATHPMSHMVSVVLSRPDGGFDPAQAHACGTSPYGSVVADFNGDGVMDIAVANLAGLLPSQPGTTVTILQGSGNGRFRQPVAIPVLNQRPNYLAAGDVNGDGRADLLVASSNTPAVPQLLLGNADGTLSPAPALFAPLGIPNGVAIEDMDGDGKADLLASILPRIWVWRGRGNGTFENPTSVDFEGTSFTMADVNGDGRKDLIGANAPYGVAIVVLNRGVEGLGEQLAFSVGSLPLDVAVGDFSGDGVADLITADQGTPNFTLLRNTTARPVMANNGVVNAASYRSGPVTVAPGEIITIFGRNLGPDQLVTARLRTPEYLDTTLARTRVLFNGTPAPLIYVRSDQVSAVVPYGARPGGTITLQVENGVMFSAPMSLQVMAAHPGVFTLNASGSGGVAAINQDGTLNTPERPAAKGSIVVFFATGEGLTNPPGIDGKISTIPLPSPLLDVVVGIANQGAEILYAGATPGLVAGLMQINARIPLDAPSGARVPLIIKVGEAFSQPGVTIAIE